MRMYHEGYPGWFAPANSTVVCENERRGRFVLETEESQPWRADIEERFGGVPLKTDYAMPDANCRAFRFRWLAEWYAGDKRRRIVNSSRPLSSDQLLNRLGRARVWRFGTSGAKP